jgi:hypothetical protein
MIIPYVIEENGKRLKNDRIGGDESYLFLFFRFLSRLSFAARHVLVDEGLLLFAIKSDEGSAASRPIDPGVLGHLRISA